MFDNARLEVHCLGCGVLVPQTLRWFSLTSEFVCPHCGQTLENRNSSFTDLIKWMSEKGKALFSCLL